MKVAFTSSPEFKKFKDVMRRLIQVPKAEVDELVAEAKESSLRNNNPNAPGRKRSKKRAGRSA
jgi:hypothetical protein